MKTVSPDELQNRLHSLPQYEPQTDEEIQTLERLWQSRQLDRHLESLEAFYHQNRETLIRLLDAIPTESNLLDAAKLLIIENFIVDRLAEAMDQRKAMESEIWIQGERGNYDRERIACEWADRHAESWRLWRIKEYLFAVSRMGNRLERCLAKAG